MRFGFILVALEPLREYDLERLPEDKVGLRPRLLSALLSMLLVGLAMSDEFFLPVLSSILLVAFLFNLVITLVIAMASLNVSAFSGS